MVGAKERSILREELRGGGDVREKGRRRDASTK
jgi:hypothetical protein